VYVCVCVCVCVCMRMGKLVNVPKYNFNQATNFYGSCWAVFRNYKIKMAINYAVRGFHNFFDALWSVMGCDSM